MYVCRSVRNGFTIEIYGFMHSSVCMYVCLSVRNGFTIEIYGFMHSSGTFWHVPLRMASRVGMEIEVKDSEDRR